MNSLNSVLIEGNVVRDPVAALTPKGTPVCNFSIASDRYFRNEGAGETQKEASYFDVEAWGRLAERCTEEMGKGRSVRVVGRLKQDRWETPEGEKRSRVKIVAEHVEFRSMKAPTTEEVDDEPIAVGY